MKTVYLLSLCTLILAGCSSNIQVVTLRGSNVKPTDKGLVLDNDTLMLQYTFASKRGRMSLAITNKLNQPLYIDWKRSSLIIGEDKIDYWYDISDVALTASSFPNKYARYSLSKSQITGTISKEDQISFIPPKAKISRQQYSIFPTGNLHLFGTPEVSHEKALWGASHKKTIMVNTYTYSDTKSPFLFRNYLTLGTDKEFKNEFHIDTKFWASDVKVMPSNQALSVYQPDGSYSRYIVFDKPDAFYVPLPIQQ